MKKYEIRSDLTERTEAIIRSSAGIITDGTAAPVLTEDAELNRQIFEDIPDQFSQDTECIISKIRSLCGYTYVSKNISFYKTKKEETENPDSIDKQNITVKKTKKKYSTKKNVSPIEKHFSERNLDIYGSHSPENFNALRNMTMYIGRNYEHCSDFLKCIKKAIADKSHKVVYKLTNNDIKNKAVRSVSEMFSKYRIFSSCKFNKNDICATVAGASKIIAYLNGYWLELFCSFTIEEILSEISKKYGLKTELLMNLNLRDRLSGSGIPVHEIDIAFSIDSKVYAVEAKSGKFNDYEKLHKTRSQLGFVPDHYILVHSEPINSETTEMLHYFYEYFITDLKNLRSDVYKMIGFTE